MSDRFTQVVTTFVPRLCHDVGFTVEQACGVIGANGGWESGLFTRYQEMGSGKNSGGRGWMQWTGPRRIAFLSYCKVHGYNPTTDEASYNYLLMELHGVYASVAAAVKRCRTMAEAAEVFERRYEAAGKPCMSRRIALGRRAVAIMHPGHSEAAAPVAPRVVRKPLADKRRVGHVGKHHHR